MKQQKQTWEENKNLKEVFVVQLDGGNNPNNS